MWREKDYLWRGEHEGCTQLTEALSTWDLYSCLSMTLKNIRSSYLRRAPVTPTAGVHALLLNHVWLCATLWTIACQALLSMGFCRKEYWSGLPFPSPGDLPSSGTEPVSPALAGRFFTTEPPAGPVTLTGLHWNDVKSWCKPMTHPRCTHEMIPLAFRAQLYRPIQRSAEGMPRPALSDSRHDFWMES